MNVLGTSNSSSNGGNIVGVVYRLTSDELSTSLGEGNHDGTTILGCSLHTGVDRVGSNNVDSGDGISLLLSIIEEVSEGSSRNNTRLDGSWKLCKCLFIFLLKNAHIIC